MGGIFMIYLEDIPLGHKSDLGTYTFSKDEIIEFASQWDPQPFHTDDDAAKDSMFGGLVASGWHVVCIWMKLMVKNRAEELRAGGEEVSGGVSPGFRDLKWLAPVRPGDTIHYWTTTQEKVELKSRPQFGIIRSLNEGFNQDGVLVMSFVGQGYIGRRPK